VPWTTAMEALVTPGARVDEYSVAMA
jgi:hypothetical protein